MLKKNWFVKATPKQAVCGCILVLTGGKTNRKKYEQDFKKKFRYLSIKQHQPRMVKNVYSNFAHTLNVMRNN